MSVTQQQVVSLLENELFESSTQAAANAATWQANAAATSVSALATAMASSGEEKIAATVVGFYITSLGRAPTAAEIQYYTAVAEQGLTTAQISAGQVSNGTWDQIAGYFSHSPEFATRAGLDYSLGSTGALLEAVPVLYESVLGRTPTSAEISYYDNQITSGTDLGVLFREFTASPEFHTDTDVQIAKALAAYGNSAASGATTSISTIGSTVTIGTPVTTPPPSPPTSTPATFHSLTTGTDTIDDSALAGANTYTATLGTGATLNAGDHLIGNGLATLAITDTTDTHVMLVGTLAGIQTMTVGTAGTPVANVGTNAGSTFDVHALSPALTSLSVYTSGSLGDFITAARHLAVSVTTEGTGSVSIDNAGTVNISGVSLSDVTLLGSIGATTIDNTDTVPPVDLFATIHTQGSTITSLAYNGGTMTISDTSVSTPTFIAQITDSNLDSLVVSGNVRFGTGPGYLSALPSSVTSLDLSNDTANAYFDASGNTTTLTLDLAQGQYFIEGLPSSGSSWTLEGSPVSGGYVTLSDFHNLTLDADSDYYQSIIITGHADLVTVNDNALLGFIVEDSTITTIADTNSSLTLTEIDVETLITTISDGNLSTLTLSGLVTVGTLDYSDATGPVALSITGSRAQSHIGTISDPENALISLTVSGDVTLGSTSVSLSLGADVHTLDLSADTEPFTNYLTLNASATLTLGSTSNEITIGTNGLTLTFGGSPTGTNDIIVGPAASYASVPNLILTNLPAAATIHLGTQTGLTIGASSLSIPLSGFGSIDVISTLESAVGTDGAGKVEWAVDNTFHNTYILESSDGTVTPGDTHATLIEITGTHFVSIVGGAISVT